MQTRCWAKVVIHPFMWDTVNDASSCNPRRFSPPSTSPSGILPFEKSVADGLGTTWNAPELHRIYEVVLPQNSQPVTSTNLQLV